MNYDWVEATLGRISDILRMPDRHNSYATPKVDPKDAWDAVDILWQTMTSCTPAPVITPTNYAGLQFDWSGIDTEVRLVVDRADPEHRVRVHLFGKAPGYQPGMFATPEQILERALRVIERELGLSCSEAAPAP